MSRYHSLGKIPKKRHTTFRKKDGSLYHEELFSTEGFSNIHSLLYHLYPPTIVSEVKDLGDIAPEVAVEKNMKAFNFSGFSLPSKKDYLESRSALLVNDDLHLSLAAPESFSDEYFFKNADADELLFVHKGKGVLRTNYGKIKFAYGDYLVIPRGTIYKIDFETKDNRLLIVESFAPIYTPKRYRNEFGQLMEHSPFCERDIRPPEDLETIDKKGNFKILMKKQQRLWEYQYLSHPFDLVGWDGYFYPYAFSIFDFEPITGRVHLPPPTHQTFESMGFVVCSFVPRMYDYHPEAIPAPYHHSNIDSDEVLYYVEGNFMSRKNIKEGQITLHPAGIPHGPHPGTLEKSIGKKETKELAVMIDPFSPLKITKTALQIENEGYYKSWIIN